MVIPVVVAAGCATGPCWSWSSGLDVVVVVACSAAGIVSLITRQISKQGFRNQGLIHGSSDWDALIRVDGDDLDDCVARAAKKGKQITGSVGQPAGNNEAKSAYRSVVVMVCACTAAKKEPSRARDPKIDHISKTPSPLWTVTSEEDWSASTTRTKDLEVARR